ncbi:MAG: DNA-packaging protein [Pikeienuella sp.]
MQQSPADQLAALPKSEQEAFIATLSETEAEALLYDWRGFLARSDQIAPEGDWDIWLALAGRGWGKTRAGAEWIKEQVEAGARNIAFVAETSADARDVMVEGESGILAVYPEKERPIYEPSKRRVTWANGARATLFNAVEPDQLRGPQFDAAWCDELAKWKYAREAWDMLQFALRLGEHPRVLATTTPRPIELIKAILAGEEGNVTVTRGRTMDNAANLAAPFLRKVTVRYEGTRLGRQELNAEVLGDLPGALWTQGVLDQYREREAPELGRTVVAVDPAVTNEQDSNDHGIIVGALGPDQTGYVIEDYSMGGSPKEWATKVAQVSRQHAADGVVIEVNQGGDLVAHTLRTVAPNLNIIEVRASKGKHVRAEPVAALYEQGRIRHVGQFSELEAQMTQFTTAGYQGTGSPDRVDALVWAMTELFPDMVDPLPDLARLEIPPSGSWMA